MELNSKNKNIFLILLFSIISIMFSFSNFNNIDSDLLWHLKLGEEILQNGINVKDIFSWQEGLSWISQHWLFDIYIYEIVSLFGNVGFKLSMALTFFLIFYFSFLENKEYKSLILFVGFALCRLFFNQNYFNRPSIYSILLIILLWKILLNENNLVKKLIKVFLLSIFIANIHGGCLITCLLIISIFILFDFVLLLLNRENLLKQDVLSLIVFFIGGFINPFTYKIYEVGLKVQNLESSKFILEWKSLDFNTINEVILFIFSLLVIIAIVDSKNFKNLTRHSFICLGMTCALLIGGIMSVRGLILTSSFIIVFNYKYFEEFVFKYIEKMHFIDKFKDFKFIKFFKRILKNNAFIIVITIFIFFVIENIPDLKNNDFKNHIENNSPYSYKIINYIKENLNGEEIYNDYNTGNYLIFNDCKSFIDSRQQPFTVEFDGNDSLNDYIKIVFSKNYYKDLLLLIEKYNIEYVFWTNEINVGYDVYEDFKNDFDIILEDDEIKKDESDGIYKQYLFKKK